MYEKFPNYKESISENSGAAYDKASDIIHSGSVNVKDYSREKLGEDNYMKIKSYKDLFVEQTNQDWNEFTDIVRLEPKYICQLSYLFINEFLCQLERLTLFNNSTSSNLPWRK